MTPSASPPQAQSLPAPTPQSLPMNSETSASAAGMHPAPPTSLLSARTSEILPSRRTSEALPSLATTRQWIEADRVVVGYRVLSGTGEELGRAVGLERDQDGIPKWLVFEESPGAPPRRVKLRFIRGVNDGVIRLAGPREGYHITRVGTYS